MQPRLVLLLGAISLAAIVTGCANPGIVKMSADTYLLSRTDRGGIFGNASAMKTDVIREANEFAASQGKIAVPVSLNESPMYIGHFASVDYLFRIVDKSDPEAQRVNRVPRPNVVTEKAEKASVGDMGASKEKEDLIEFKVIGYSFGKKKNLRDDYNEALVDAKIKAIERAGIKVDSITKVENFEVKSDMVETQSKGTIEPGYEIIEVGYDESGVYKILMIGKVRTRLK
jgi:hypothetical protein